MDEATRVCSDSRCNEPTFPNSDFCQKHLEEQIGELVEPTNKLLEVDALQAAKLVMKWKEGWRDQANDADTQEMHDEYVEKEDVCRADAIVYAAIASAEAAQRQAAAMERIANALYAPQGMTLSSADILSAIASMQAG